MQRLRKLNTIKLTLFDSHYKVHFTDDVKRNILAGFLATEVKDSLRHIKYILHEPFGIGSDLYFIRRFQNHVRIGMLFGVNEEFLIPINKFIQLIHLWNKAYKDRPQEMELQMDDNYNFNIVYDITKK